MLYDLLLDIVYKRHLSDINLLLLLILAFALSWFTMLSLGFHIMNVKIKLKHIVPGVLVGSSIAIFIKPFIPGSLAFFVTLLPLLVFLKIYSKNKWIITSWVTFILLLSTAIIPMLLISPLSSVNHAFGLFFFKNRYGMLVISLSETLGAVLLLGFLKIFNISIIPNPIRSLTSIDFVDIYLFLALCYWCYHSTMEIWKSPMQFSMWTLLIWTIAAGALVAFYIHKVNDQRKNQEYQKKDQEYQHLKESKVDSQDLTDFSDKLHKTLHPNPDPDFDNLPEIKLTRRETDVLRCIAKGYDNAAIAKELILSESHIVNVVSAIRAKLNEKIDVSDRSLAIYAFKWSKKKDK